MKHRILLAGVLTLSAFTGLVSSASADDWGRHGRGWDRRNDAYCNDRRYDRRDDWRYRDRYDHRRYDRRDDWRYDNYRHRRDRSDSGDIVKGAIIGAIVGAIIR